MNLAMILRCLFSIFYLRRFGGNTLVPREHISLRKISSTKTGLDKFNVVRPKNWVRNFNNGRANLKCVSDLETTGNTFFSVLLK